MISLAEFFKLNQSIIYFVYGLVFFILGFAIILQTRQSSRLDLARSLRWLAAFGIAHGFYEWGDLFIPIQAEYLSETTTEVLYLAHLILLAFSFICLLEFGLALLYPPQRGLLIHWQSLSMLVLWLVIVFAILPFFIPDVRLLHHTGNALARYFIQFPGGMLAAYGLRKHTMERIVPLNAPRIVQTIQIAGIALAIYSIVGGLTPPPVEFFPGNVLNAQVFADLVGMPPLVFRSLTGVVITIALIRGLEIFSLETERRIEALEQQQIINAERERLARELHDGAIQKVYTAGLLVESASRLADSKSEIGTRLDKSIIVLNDAIADLRRNLSELHAGSAIQTESLPTLLQQMAENPHYTSMVNITLETDLLKSKSLSPRRSSHVFAIVNESLANTVRHAQAKQVEIRAQDLGTCLQIEIKDNGIGIPSEPKAGYGLRNMRDRARLLNGNLEFTNNKGTTITLTIPWVDH